MVKLGIKHRLIDRVHSLSFHALSRTDFVPRIYRGVLNSTLQQGQPARPHGLWTLVLSFVGICPGHRFFFLVKETRREHVMSSGITQPQV